MTAREAENPPLEIEAQAARRGEDAVESREVRVRRRDEGRELLEKLDAGHEDDGTYAARLSTCCSVTATMRSRCRCS